MLNKLSFVITTVTILLFGFIVEEYVDWWYLSIVAFVMTFLLYQKPFYAFLSSFLGGFLEWFFLAAYIDIQNHKILSHRLATLFFDNSASFILILCSGIIGGLTAGLAGLFGCHLRRLIWRKKIHSH